MNYRNVVAVILNYRRPDETVECLSSLAASKQQLLRRTIVVDNDPGDGSAARMLAGHPEVEVIESKENRGYAGGMNAGLRRALDLDAAYILVINSDVLVKNDTVPALVQALDDHPGAGAATGTFFYYPDTRRVWYAGGSLAYGRAHAVTDRVFVADTAAGSPVARSVTFLTGCAILIRASALRTAGLFDERYFMYLEDVELSRRFLSHGFDLLYIPRATFYHRLDVDEQTPLKTYYVTRNRLLFLETAPTVLKRLTGTAYVVLVLIVKLAGWALVDRPAARAAVMGVKDYFSGVFHAGRGLTLSLGQNGSRRNDAHRD
jgi:GT2 family glycosyltransferase